MYIEFDVAKDEANCSKHSISLQRAADIDWSTVIARLDTRQDYGEVREIGYGLIDGRLHCVVFVRLSEERFRVISLRRANDREISAYEEEKDHQTNS